VIGRKKLFLNRVAFCFVINFAEPAFLIFALEPHFELVPDEDGFVRDDWVGWMVFVVFVAQQKE
jgi:hypothetical protein